MKLHSDIKLILSKLPDDTLFALAATVTQRLLKSKIKNRDEAIEVIVKHSPDELSILKRKSVTKDVLFEYLHKNDVAVPVPATKSVLIDKICNYWQLQVAPYKFEETHTQSSNASETESATETLGEKFAEWFYNMCNTSPAIGAEHFWGDCSLTLNLLSDEQTITERVSDDCEKIAALLSHTKTVHTLFFNPNLTREGIKTRTEPHGLVVVMVCGTLHTDRECVGVFEQVFGLARDPFSENNWKIRNTVLNLRSKSGVCGVPKLCDDAEGTSNCLSITEC